ncbi:MAG: hypothetical protein ACYCQJ_03950 [Nitrososphaerales archaeon]
MTEDDIKIDNPPPCPSCQSSSAVPILYGYPSREARIAANLGKASLGGCVISSDLPRWVCRQCGNRFGQNIESFSLDGILNL